METHQDLVIICEKIALREVFGAVHEKFKEYAKLKQFTQEQTNEIKRMENVTDERDLQILELKQYMKDRLDEKDRKIQELENIVRQIKKDNDTSIIKQNQWQKDFVEGYCSQWKNFVDNYNTAKKGLIEAQQKYIKHGQFTFDKLLQIGYSMSNNTLSMINYARRNLTADCLKDIHPQEVNIWMMLWAERSNLRDLTKELCTKYFGDIKVQLLSEFTCKHIGCQVLPIHTAYVPPEDPAPEKLGTYTMQYLHIIYGLSNQAITKLLRLDVSIEKKDADIRGPLLNLALIIFHYNVDVKVLAYHPKEKWGEEFKEYRNLSLDQYQGDGPIAQVIGVCPQQFQCKNGKLYPIKKTWRNLPIAPIK